MHMQIHRQIQIQYRRKQIHANSVVQARTVYYLLTSVLRHEERDTILTMLTIPNARHISRCLRSQFISVGRDPEISTLRFNGRIPNYSTPWQKLNSLPPWSNLNSHLTLFQNPQILRTISSGHDVIHTPVPFPVWGLL